MPIVKKRTNHSMKMDRLKRSKQVHERGVGAPKKGNPRYAPKMITDKNGNKKKVYIVRKVKKRVARKSKR